jgi:hypothetical protein
MVERIVTFLILGFFVFGPKMQSFWSRDPMTWYLNLLVWLVLIVACFWSQYREFRIPRK